ncbi:MAG TPA: hypothetical protein VKP68_09865, partial [Ramlibacter sp.]|nr:hypothetical protein [Ramlibacter sp.]
MDGAPDLRDDLNRVEAPTPRARRQRLREWIPTLAVVLVVITAVATAVMVALPSVSELDHRPAAAATQQ